jgi:hypothetical protein
MTSHDNQRAHRGLQPFSTWAWPCGAAQEDRTQKPSGSIDTDKPRRLQASRAISGVDLGSQFLSERTTGFFDKSTRLTYGLANLTADVFPEGCSSRCRKGLNLNSSVSRGQSHGRNRSGLFVHLNLNIHTVQSCNEYGSEVDAVHSVG